ncbi:hypothetical protein ACFRCX_20985 [Streptomyces sp. NPDC056652]|uniref:MmyB family transcriptional regulator n=1 Tax=Streptomyces sp. NPDC056652 TaxID=3345893 RepID=UPI0036D0D9F9
MWFFRSCPRRTRRHAERFRRGAPGLRGPCGRRTPPAQVRAAPHSPAQARAPPSTRRTFARASAQQLRAVAARYPEDPEVAELVTELLAGSEEFTRLWGSHDVSAEPTLRKTFQHPLVGPVTVDCDALDITDRDQRVVIYTAAPGSPSEEALRLLSVVGTQRMDVAR